MNMRPYSQGRSQGPLAEDGPKSQVDKVASERRPTAAKWAKYFAKTTKYFEKTTKYFAKATLEENTSCWPLSYKYFA